jgi:hypothetical protein
MRRRGRRRRRRRMRRMRVPAWASVSSNPFHEPF